MPKDVQDFLSMSLDQVIAERRKSKHSTYSSSYNDRRPRTSRRTFNNYRRGSPLIRLHISNLHYQILEDDLEELFGNAHNIKLAYVNVRLD